MDPFTTRKVTIPATLNNDLLVFLQKHGLVNKNESVRKDSDSVVYVGEIKDARKHFVQDLDLPYGLISILHRMAVTTLEDLIETWTAQDLLKVKNFGAKKLTELERVLRIYGMQLKK